MRFPFNLGKKVVGQWGLRDFKALPFLRCVLPIECDPLTRKNLEEEKHLNEA